jgi:hypothetical protein
MQRMKIFIAVNVLMFGNQTEQRKPIRSYEATPNVTLSKMTPK